jgi:deoxyadenosine/deoxycytidine kinase
MQASSDIKVVVGGPCGSGKSTLVEGLKKYGINARPVAQEHSNVPHMYLMSAPDFVILLDCSYHTITARKKVGWTREQIKDQLHKLRKMRKDCNLFIGTDNLSIEDVYNKALAAIGDFKKMGGK